jgi:malonate-semialdehyde dehydrogenase (acetylating)/methylmalonate-semialdehyde dehydrogenase
VALIQHFINGEDFGTAERTGVVYNPATGEHQHDVIFGSVSDVEAAIAAARAALPAWRSMSLTKRSHIFFQLRHLLAERADEIAAAITSEHGKVLSDAAGEVARGLENVEFASGLMNLLKGEFSQQVSGGVDVHSVKEPVGVVGCITPFNFPAMVPLWMIASAIACGNTVVLKPSENDPSASVQRA